MGQPEEYLRTVERMEPDITPVDHAGAMASLAISARRPAPSVADVIADSLENLQARLSPEGLADRVRHLVPELQAAIEEGSKP